MTSRPHAMSNQRWSNVVCVSVEIYNVEQRRINVVYFNVDLNSIRQRRNNVVIFNVDFHNVEQRYEFDNLKKIKIEPRVKNKIILLSFKEYTGLKIFFISFSILRGICKRVFAKPQKFLKHQIYWITKTIFKQSQFVKCQYVFNFKRRHVQLDYHYGSFNFIYIF